MDLVLIVFLILLYNGWKQYLHYELEMTKISPPSSALCPHILAEEIDSTFSQMVDEERLDWLDSIDQESPAAMVYTSSGWRFVPKGSGVDWTASSEGIGYSFVIPLDVPSGTFREVVDQAMDGGEGESNP